MAGPCYAHSRTNFLFLYSNYQGLDRTSNPNSTGKWAAFESPPIQLSGNGFTTMEFAYHMKSRVWNNYGVSTMGELAVDVWDGAIWTQVSGQLKHIYTKGSGVRFDQGC